MRRRNRRPKPRKCKRPRKKAGADRRERIPCCEKARSAPARAPDVGRKISNKRRPRPPFFLPLSKKRRPLSRAVPASAPRAAAESEPHQGKTRQPQRRGLRNRSGAEV